MEWNATIGPHGDDTNDPVDPSEEVASPPSTSVLDKLNSIIKKKGPVGEVDYITKLKELTNNLDDEGNLILPKIITLADCSRDDRRAPELIEGLLRMGHKCMISSGSKAGKSYLAIEMGLMLASGGKFLGHQCIKSCVLYVNLEIDDESFIKRLHDVEERMGLDYEHTELEKNFKFLNLRGVSSSLEKLAPALVKAMDAEYKQSRRKFSSIIIDPIYKISNGEENNARDVGKFCKQLDMISRATRCSVIYVHHHSKGDQGYKKAIDRASGSGVFGRDVDLGIDMVELEKNSDVVAALRASKARNLILEIAKEENDDNMIRIASSGKYDESGLIYDAYKKSVGENVAWGKLAYYNERLEKKFEEWLFRISLERVEYTLREFAPHRPQDVIFDHPIHILDEDGILSLTSPECHIQQDYKAKAKQTNEAKSESRTSNLREAIVRNFGQVSDKEGMEAIGIKSLNTYKKFIENNSDLFVRTLGSDGKCVTTLTENE